MSRVRTAALLLLVALGAAGCAVGPDPDRDRAALERTDDAILAAFARGDVDGVMAYHHPDVAKALAYDKYLVGREAVRRDLSATFGLFRLEFVEHRVESLSFHDGTAVEQTAFTIKGTPRAGGTPFLFKGRALVVYVRYSGSPSGWASIREMIQPAPP